MEKNRTSIERAFELAKSGQFVNLSALIQKLNSEGYSGNQIEGPVLRKQITRIIQDAAKARGETLSAKAVEPEIS